MGHENYTRGTSENKSKMEMFSMSCFGHNQHNQNMILQEYVNYLASALY